MEAKIEGMDVRASLGFLAKWLWLIVLAAVGAALGAYFLSKATPPTYEATAKVLVEGRASPGLPSAGDLETSRQLAKNYASLIGTRPLLQKVIDRMGLPYGPDSLARKISVTNPSTLVEIKIKDRSPLVAAEIANATAQTFIDDFLDRQLTQISRFQASLGQYGIAQDPSIIAAQAATLSTLSLAEEAVPPSTPSSPNTRKNVIIGAMLGLLVAALATFVLHQMDDSVQTPEDLKNAAPANPGSGPDVVSLGSVAFQRLKNGAFPIIPEEESHGSPLRESYKYIVLNLEFSGIKTGELRTILITSALPQEGKTTTSTNLGISMALEGKSVILVDADLKRPALHKVFGLENSKGLTNALLGKASLDEVLQPTGFERLKVVPSGPIPPDSTPVLRSRLMSDVIKSLRERADVVIFDSPPVLAAADPILLASLLDAVLVVVDAQRGRRSAFRRTIQSLQQPGIGLVGTVLNKTGERRGGYYRYYKYGYSYSYSPYSSDKNGEGPRREAGIRSRLLSMILGSRK